MTFNANSETGKQIFAIPERVNTHTYGSLRKGGAGRELIFEHSWENGK